MNSHIRKLPMLEAAIFEASTAIKLELPFYASGVPAGFPSPADDYLDKRLDLNEHLVRNPAATFFVRVDGDSMIGAGINNGDLAIVDRSSDYRDGSIVLARIGGEFTIKRLRRREGQVMLEAANPKYQPLHVTEEMEFEVWGVVTSSITQFR